MLEGRIHHRIRQAREKDPQAFGLSLVYAFAEQQMMHNMVDTLEALLEVTGSLFGTSTWLTHENCISTRHEDTDHKWFSTFQREEA